MALVEFAMVLPFLMILTTSALELTNYAITVKRVGELGVMVSDNASRMGAQSAINDKPITARFLRSPPAIIFATSILSGRSN